MYLFSAIPEGFKELTLAGGQTLIEYDCLLWVGKSKLKSWKAPRLKWVADEFTSESDLMPDIAGFAGTLIVSEKAYHILKDLVVEQVEFLPTIGPGDADKWYVVNIVNVVDIMLKEKSQYEIYSDGEVGNCTHAFLNEPPPDNKIFKVAGWPTRMFASEEIKLAVEINSLNGGLIREYLNP